jgi:hypothetical protein
MDDSESSLPVSGSALQVSRLSGIHEVADFNTPDGLLTTDTGRVRNSCHPVGMAHDDALVESHCSPEGCHAGHGPKGDPPKVTMGCDVARMELIEGVKELDAVLLEVAHDINPVGTVLAHKGRSILLKVCARAQVMIALNDPEGPVIPGPDSGNELVSEVMGFLENVALILFPSVLRPSGRTLEVQGITNLNHFIRLNVPDELNDIGKSRPVVLRRLNIRHDYNSLAQMPSFLREVRAP